MMEKGKEKEEEQWRGAVEARLPSTPAAAAWPHVADFFALHRYLPGIDVCSRAAGDDEDAGGGGGGVRPGCVRYCASFAPGTEEVATWAREELVELDARGRRLAYAVVASNMGFGRYVASMMVLPVLPAGEEAEAEQAQEGTADDAGGVGSSGCSRLVWAFECEPVQGWSRDGLLGYLDAAVRTMAARIEQEAIPPVVLANAEEELSPL